MAEWRVYGCGSASSNRSHQSSYEFVDGEKRIQIDMGNGSMQQRCSSFGSIQKAMDSITHIFLTHSHPDHTADLTRHIVAWKYTPGYSPGKKVHLYGTEKTLQRIFLLLEATGFSHLYDEVYIPHVIVPNKTISINTISIKPFEVHHMEGSVGLSIRSSNGKRVCFTSDTSMNESLIPSITGHDLLVMECSFFTTTHPMHLNLEQSSCLAAEAKAKSLLLVHFYPEMEEKSQEELTLHASQWYNAPIFFAQDGMSLKWIESKKQWLKQLLIK